MKRLIFTIFALLYSSFSMAESMLVSEVLTQSHNKNFLGCDGAIKTYFEKLPFQNQRSIKFVTVRPKFMVEQNDATGRKERYRLKEPEIQVVVGSDNPNFIEATSFVEVGIQNSGGYCIFRNAATLLSGDSYNGCDSNRNLSGIDVGKFYWQTEKNNPDLGSNFVCIDVQSSQFKSGKTDASLILQRGQEIEQFPADKTKK